MAQTTEVMCLDTCEIFPTPQAAGESCGTTADLIGAACLGRTERAGGLRWAAVVDGWIMGYDPWPEPHMARKWTVDEHRRIMGLAEREAGPRAKAPGDERIRKEDESG